MQLVTIDFETFYDQEYSLSKMSTQEYIQDERFEVIGAAISLNGTPPQWWEGKTGVSYALRHIMNQPDKQILSVSHNAVFDATILTHHFPEFVATRHACTMSMARAVGVDAKVGGSLSAIAKFLQEAGIDVPSKGDEVVRAKGKRLADFEQDELQAYAQYCKTDTQICLIAFMTFLQMIPKQEMAWQDTVIRMHTNPALTLNRTTLERDLVRVIDRRQTLVNNVMEQFGVTSEEQLRATLRSNEKFAQLLLRMGITPPMKPSPTNPEKETYAFAKTDPGMKDLLEHDNEDIQALAACRVGLRSTIEQTRLESFIRISKYPWFAIPCTVSGAHTHRLGGADKLNIQNLPSGRKEGQSDALRRSIEAPAGSVVVAGDSAQIEARVLAYMANQIDLLSIFSNKGDPYSDMASKIYGIPAQEIIDGKDRGERKYVLMRQLGKATILGCGYQMGKVRFQESCRQDGIEISLEEAGEVVKQYRSTMDKIVAFWAECEYVLQAMIDGESGYFGGPTGKLFYFDGDRHLFHERVPGILLPDGMWMNYRDLHWGVKEFEGKEQPSMMFTRRKQGRMQKEFIYGGKLTENLTQALAFAIMKRHANVLTQMFPVCFNVHDEFVLSVPEAQVDSAKTAMITVMSRAPKWVAGLPLACEVNHAKEYGAC